MLCLCVCVCVIKERTAEMEVLEGREMKYFREAGNLNYEVAAMDLVERSGLVRTGKGEAL